MIKEDKPIELTYIVCLDVETEGPDPGGNSWPSTWHFNEVLGFYKDVNLADDAVLAFVKSEKYKALEKAAADVYVYRKAVPAFDLDSAYSVVDDVLDQIKELEE